MIKGREFLGRGFRFPLAPDRRGGLAYTEGSANIEHSVRTLLLTRLGERVMRPKFGCDAGRLVFAPASETGLRLLEDAVRGALVEYEPRIDVLLVRAERDPRAESRVTVAIRYRERRTNAAFNLVFPFYLGDAGGVGRTVTFPALTLSDVTWDELVALARRRIPALSRGQWTLHAPVDPGITLLELFAWLLEQRVYFLDQVPAATRRALLGLLGVVPRPAEIATTVLEIEASASAFEVRAQTEVELEAVRTLPASTRENAKASVVFTLAGDLTVLPVRGLRLLAGGRDRSADLERRRGVALLPANGGSGRFAVVLELSAPPPASAGASLSLFFELETFATREGEQVPPAWLRLGEPPPEPPAELRFLHLRSDGRLVPFAHVEDGTAGLRRSGVVRLSVPADWAPEPSSAGSYAVVVETDAATFSAPPCVREIRPNAVIARHVRRVRTSLRVEGWLPLPGNTLALEPAPLASDFALYLRERAAPDRWQRWTVVEDLAFAGPAERVARVDRERALLSFGDGLTGRLPRLAEGASPGVADAPFPIADPGHNVALEYAAGGGPAGDCGAGERFFERLGSGPGTPFFATALVSARGYEPETLEAAGERARAELAMPARAVTARDHEELALGTPDVAIARARAAVGHDPRNPCRVVPGVVSVYVVPRVPRGAGAEREAFVAHPWPDPGAVRAVDARLQALRMAGSEVFVLPPRYRQVALRFEIETDAAAASVQAAIARALARDLDPLEGGAEGQGWPFGEPLRPSSLLERAQDAIGEAGDVRAVFIGLDGEEPVLACSEVAIGEHTLPRVERIAVVRVRERGAA